jgi:mono/diheme cytochrome c family protein
VAAGAAAAVAGGAAFVYFGVYDVSATDQHLAPTYHVLDLGMKRAVKVRARRVAVPPLDEAAAARGLALYAVHCTQCHGAPGVAPEPFALAMTPVPTNLVRAGAQSSLAEIYWVVRYGLKMTGMPAWEFRLGDGEIWEVAAFVKRLPALSPAAYAKQASEKRRAVPAPADSIAGEPDADRGYRAVQQYACVTCHEIPGVVGANAHVGPSLAGFARRGIIGGSLPNDAGNVADFLRRPQAHKPAGAMPDLRVTERDARDMAAFLATLR